jgi:hypothetical protein
MHAFLHAIPLHKLQQSALTASSHALHSVMKVTMTNCKISGFRQVLSVGPGSQARLKDCVVDVAIPGSYGGAGEHPKVVSVALLLCCTRVQNVGACWWHGFQSSSRSCCVLPGNGNELLSCVVLVCLLLSLSPVLVMKEVAHRIT